MGGGGDADGAGADRSPVEVEPDRGRGRRRGAQPARAGSASPLRGVPRTRRRRRRGTAEPPADATDVGAQRATRRNRRSEAALPPPAAGRREALAERHGRLRARGEHAERGRRRVTPARVIGVIVAAARRRRDLVRRRAVRAVHGVRAGERRGRRAPRGGRERGRHAARAPRRRRLRVLLQPVRGDRGRSRRAALRSVRAAPRDELLGGPRRPDEAAPAAAGRARRDPGGRLTPGDRRPGARRRTRRRLPGRVRSLAAARAGALRRAAEHARISRASCSRRRTTSTSARTWTRSSPSS